MFSKETAIVNDLGLDMVQAGILAKEMAIYQCDVRLIVDGKSVNVKSVMNIIAGCIKKGDKVTVCADGIGEEEAVNKAVSLIESGFTN
ncbi:MAG: HPr family phosphocarrier protein [Lachnospiraceae bacterium]|nr:HPr family phosphocarrier protein [Lachnospiraceae bacterium]